MDSRLDRQALRRALRPDEESHIASLLAANPLSPAGQADAATIALDLAGAVRAHRATGLDGFLHAYDLTSQEGIALMCLAEALLRVPDAGTIDSLIEDKLGHRDWRESLTGTPSTFVNAATFGLMLTGQVIDWRHNEGQGWPAVIGRALARLGEPVIRESVAQAMKILGGQFVFARTIDEALSRASQSPDHETHSFDMLGEAARTAADARKYLDAYQKALDAICRAAKGGRHQSAGMSVKLSALYPRYEALKAPEVVAAITGPLTDLARQAEKAGVSFTIDAEECDRLELSLDIIEEVTGEGALFRNGWDGFGLAVQAYQKRAQALSQWVIDLARARRAKLMVRLVKGAYWDSEIKAAQVLGVSDYPVFTRKAGTDLSYLAAAKKLLDARDVIYPAFATHNAQTAAAILVMAGKQEFEFQRLHGMGEPLYTALAAAASAKGEAPPRLRVYAPVGSHKELLAYLVRRLLENGANSSFVNRIADSAVPLNDLIRDPADILREGGYRHGGIPKPSQLFAPSRLNSTGIDLADPVERGALMAALTQEAENHYRAVPPGAAPDGVGLAVRNPANQGEVVGHWVATPVDAIGALSERAKAAQPAWDRMGGAARAAILDQAAGLMEQQRTLFLSLAIREAGKTLPDAIAEIREAVDFLRFYAAEARRIFAGGTQLPGPTGERNELHLHGRGVFAAIAPWNFPLAIFVGQVAAALAAGNSVLAKPAPQTPLMGDAAVKLLHQAGVPADALILVLGGSEAGAALINAPKLDGVVFTGSTATAKAIHRALANRDGPILPLIAETGGQNAMIVDSSALPEQVTRDVMASAFQSAGQRCSALRVLYLQEDVADGMIEMIAGAMETLELGNPADPRTDVGPVIDEAAKSRLTGHLTWLDKHGRMIKRLDHKLPGTGHFVPPAAYEISGIGALSGENFGPILHIVRWKGGKLDQVLDDIAATGYGLTLGLHTRIDRVREMVSARAPAGNVYVNRNQIGAVVGSQPFGGDGLSGTGPKAGGPHYLQRFATERTITIDTTAAGGNAQLMGAGG